MKPKAKVKIEDPLKAIYHLKIHLSGISPMIYRRFTIPGDTHIAQLHHLIQIVMGWYNDHLHNFHIWGVDFGISYYGQPGFRNDPCKVLIGDFGFKAGDQFTYIYDYGDYWLHEIRVEKVENASQEGILPKCIEGKRGCPPEDCGGAIGYEDLLLDYFIWQRETLLDLLEKLEAGRRPDMDDYYDDVPYWYRGHKPEHFDKARINKAIQKMYQKKGDCSFWKTLGGYEDFIED